LHGNPPEGGSYITATEFLRDRYIIRFNKYRMVSEHKAALESLLGPPVNAVSELSGGVGGGSGGSDSLTSADSARQLNAARAIVGDSSTCSGGTMSFGGGCPLTATQPISGDGGGSGGRPVVWEWVERNNKAMAYPTDFAVIRLEGADGAANGASSPSPPANQSTHQVNASGDSGDAGAIGAGTAGIGEHSAGISRGELRALKALIAAAPQVNNLDANR
jgi:hypothetical protein